jgi:hypothetical protein
MATRDAITLVLAILSTVILIRLLLPDILAVLGLSPLQNGFSAGPEDANSYWPTKLDEDLYQEILALGFQPLGTYWEQLHFTRRFDEFVFTRTEEKCFGILYPNDQIMSRRASFFTVFETGGVVFTKNYCGGLEIQEGDFLATGARTVSERRLPTPPLAPADSAWKRVLFCLAAGLVIATLVSASSLSSQLIIALGVLSGLAAFVALLPVLLRLTTPSNPEPEPVDLDLRISLSETLQRHRLNVNLLIAEGQQLPAVFDEEEFIATQKRYYRHPRLRMQFISAMATLLLAKLIILAPLPTFFFYRLGVRDPLPWVVLLGEGLVGLYLRYGCSSARVVNILRSFTRDQPRT